MKTSTKQAKISRLSVRKTLMAIAVISIMGGMTIAPALSKDGDDAHGHADQGWHKGETRGNRDDRRQPAHRPEYRDPHYYSRPVYVPPAVYYPPPASPGISLFFPLDLR
ncbi:MAG TPA: hypothetical protein VKS43_04925 [Burkholderiales bacterium]|nr:hypothetical protein [Burkholderiales bacterium]